MCCGSIFGNSSLLPVSTIITQDPLIFENPFNQFFFRTDPVPALPK